MSLQTTAPDRRDAADRVVLLIPVFNDWEATRLLLLKADPILLASIRKVSVLLVDDGSDEPPPPGLGDTPYAGIAGIDVLALRRNLGHQRAIAIGLAYAYEQMNPRAVVVMDGDGEDAPEDVPLLFAKLQEGGERSIVFAERRRRSESLVFRVFYWMYRSIHLLLTGIPVRVGNFSVVPASQLRRLVVVSELWNHYAAAVFKARLPRDSVPTSRAQRLSGTSRMNFVALVSHGLSALSVHAEVIGVRLLVLTLGAAATVLALIGAVVGVRLFTTLAVPGWATSATGVLLILLSQAIAFAVVFVFLVLHARSQPLFIPLRDYSYFVSGVTRVFPEAHLDSGRR